MRLRSGELNQVNAFLESILTSLRAAVIVLDRDLQVQIWNSRAQETWGLRADEVQGKFFQALDIGLPVKTLLAPFRACLLDRDCHQELTMEATNRRGRRIRCQIILTPLAGVENEVHGVIILHINGRRTCFLRRRGRAA